jgi:hypothetical protein
MYQHTGCKYIIDDVFATFASVLLINASPPEVMLAALRE